MASGSEPTTQPFNWLDFLSIFVLPFPFSSPSSVGGGGGGGHLRSYVILFLGILEGPMHYVKCSCGHKPSRLLLYTPGAPLFSGTQLLEEGKGKSCSLAQLSDNRNIKERSLLLQ